MSGFVVPGLPTTSPYQQNNPPYSPLQSPPHPPTTGYPPQQSPASYPSVPHPSQSVYPPQPVPYPVYPPTQDMQPDYIPHQPAPAYSPRSDPHANHYPPPQQAYPYPGQDYNSIMYPPNNETSHCAESNMGLATRVSAVADAAGAALASGMKTLSGDKKHTGYVKDQNNKAQSDPYHQGHGSPKPGNKGLDDVAQFGQTVLQTGLMGSKGRYAGSAIGVARSDPNKKSGGLLGTAAARGLMGHKGRIAAKAMGMGRPEGQGGISSQSVLGSGLLGSKGSQSRIVAGAAIKLVKGRIQK